MDYAALPSDDIVAITSQNLQAHHINVVTVETSSQALDIIKEMIPAGASLMNGASKTLEQIGFIDYLKEGNHGWNNLHAGIVAETDPQKQGILRKQAALSDYYLGSVHALSQTGEMVISSNTGSQLPNIVFTSTNLIFVVSTKKITSSLSDAFKRLEEYVMPLEDQRAREAYGVGTAENKVLIFKGENPYMGRTVMVILVKESLGF